MKNKKNIFIAIVSIVVIALTSLIFYYKNGISAVSSSKEEVVVKIESGMNATQMLEQLNQSGLVKNQTCAKVFLKLNHFDNLQANTYIFHKDMSLLEIFKIIENPDFKYILKSKLIIRDGNTIPQVAEEFANLLKIKKEDVIKKWADHDYLKSLIQDYWFIDEVILNKDIMFPLEGYLYPETYFVSDQEPTIESLTKLSLDMMDKKLTPYKQQIKDLGWTPHQFLSFVSVVERESLFDKDRPLIAGVFMNRLNKGMLLQSDITVNYAWQRTGVNVSFQHLKIDSKYNTYKYTGIPVGPISTVLESTMKDCINYTKHDYYFFFAKEDGTVIYSRTLNEHNKAVKENKWY